MEIQERPSVNIKEGSRIGQRVNHRTFHNVHLRLRERGEFHPYRHEVARNVHGGIIC